MAGSPEDRSGTRNATFPLESTPIRKVSASSDPEARSGTTGFSGKDGNRSANAGPDWSLAARAGVSCFGVARVGNLTSRRTLGTCAGGWASHLGGIGRRVFFSDANWGV